MRIHENSKTMSSRSNTNDEMRKERFALREKFYNSTFLPYRFRKFKSVALSRSALWIAMEDAALGNRDNVAFYVRKAFNYHPRCFLRRAERLHHLYKRILPLDSESQGKVLAILESTLPVGKVGVRPFLRESRRIHKCLKMMDKAESLLTRIRILLPVFFRTPGVLRIRFFCHLVLRTRCH